MGIGFDSTHPASQLTAEFIHGLGSLSVTNYAVSVR